MENQVKVYSLPLDGENIQNSSLPLDGGGLGWGANYLKEIFSSPVGFYLSDVEIRSVG